MRTRADEREGRGAATDVDQDNGSTRARIREAARGLFNERGYTGTKLAEIARAVGITEGNLWYHFRTKRALVQELEDEARTSIREHLARWQDSDSAAEDYIECVLYAMRQQWKIRFLLRDYAQFSTDGRGMSRDPDLTAQYEQLVRLTRRLQAEGKFRDDIPSDPEKLTRVSWMVCRYWAESVHEHEGVERIQWSDYTRGIDHHFAVLLPHLTADANEEMRSAVARVLEIFIERDRRA